MRVRLLGSVEVVEGAATRPVRGLRRKAVLAMLALHRGEVVSVDRLVDVVWDGAAPPGVANTLQSHVSHLRQVLGNRSAIVARPPGYVLDLAAEATDVELAERYIQLGTQSADPATAVAHLGNALALWRGRPLADVAGLAFLDEQADRLDGLWLRAKLALVDARLELGEHEHVVRDLEQLAAGHPFDERIVCQLMLALYRSGRQADALGVFRELRTRLDEELGIDVGKAVRDLETAILRQDPALDPVPRDPEACPPVPVPAQLPLAVGTFVGRTRHLEILDTMLTAGPGPSVAVVSGTAGVGKTALALHWAHRVAHHFPDGQLYVNLRGFDPGERPVDPARALQGFLESLGTPAARVPVDLDDRAAAYRSLLDGKRLLIVLDNARDAEQVRPLLPGSPGSLVVVTSRDQLTPLIANEGARPVRLDLLSTVESGELLGRRLGQRRMAGEPVAVVDIIDRCAGLPQALVIVAARAASEPGHPLAAAARELRDAALDALQGGDAATDIRTVFLWSYQTLSPDAAALFRALGLHPGPDVSIAGAAASAAVSHGRAVELLDELVSAHLVSPVPGGRYALHDLLRAYAIEQAFAHDSALHRRAILVRILDHYLRTAYEAAEILEPLRGSVTVPTAPPGSTVDSLGDRDGAVTWFTAEHRVLLAAVERAGAERCDQHAWQLAFHLAPYLHPRGFWHDQSVIGQTALLAARRLGDWLAQAHTHRAIAAACGQLGLLDEARGHYERALHFCDQNGDKLTAARTHLSLAWVWQSLQDPGPGLHHTRRALELYRAAGDRVGEAKSLNALGWAHALIGEYDVALNYCDQALLLAQEVGDHEGECWTWDSLGYAYSHLGDHRRAVACYERAVDLVAYLADPNCESEILAALGDAHEAAGDLDAARRSWARALVILETLEHREADRIRAKLTAATPAPATSSR